MLKILPFLKPREDSFLDLIGQLSDQANICARHLKTFVESSDDNVRTTQRRAIETARNKAREISTAMTQQLCRSFITPFDREDIQDFTEDLYKIPKTIEKVMDRIELHGLTSEKGDFSRQIDLIVLEAEAMGNMVKDLISGQSGRKIQDQVTVLYDLEHKGDAILSELLTSLFKDRSDARDLILRKDIYDMLEKVIDRYRDAAGVALQIVLKHT